MQEGIIEHQCVIKIAALVAMHGAFQTEKIVLCRKISCFKPKTNSENYQYYPFNQAVFAKTNKQRGPKCPWNPWALPSKVDEDDDGDDDNDDDCG